ncbi:LysM peptidoglycan-binding domain-containing protein [Gracilibacillus salitolerans]|uniref:LysM peptidoglycan-binding domain-containing protein n=2 Tax=Gracilibacillus salitolerans TaxID=2663022 RepID=A0A5Q2TKV6_9BACI|nr:LysM peptidoglycan-binding domain-containing protein [Gracilibacillus salitolerans]
MKIKALLTSLIVITGLTVMPGFVDAYTVKKGDTFWKIAQKHGVSTNELMHINNYSSSILYPGDKLTVPASISESDKALIARLVHAEAKGEPYAGKVAVATVILNRVDHSNFPNTIKGVVHETYENGAIYAFSPVENGEINKPADSEAKRAVEEAIAFRGQGQGSIYFYNPETAASAWIFDQQTTVKIGNHVFAK